MKSTVISVLLALLLASCDAQPSAKPVRFGSYETKRGVMRITNTRDDAVSVTGELGKDDHGEFPSFNVEPHSTKTQRWQLDLATKNCDKCDVKGRRVTFTANDKIIADFLGQQVFEDHYSCSEEGCRVD